MSIGAEILDADPPAYGAHCLIKNVTGELTVRIGAAIPSPITTRAGKLAAANPPAPVTNTAAFAKELGSDVHRGEQRIIHRRIRKPYKKRMRMPSVLDPHLADIERWPGGRAHLTALAILSRLAEQRPEQFGPPKHTIVQRLLRSLRRKAAEATPRTGVAPAGDPGIGAAAACDG